MVLCVIIVLVFLVALLGGIGLACGYPQLDVKQSRGRVYSPVEEADLDAIQWPISSAVIDLPVEPAENAFPLHYRSPLLDRPPNPDLDIVYSHLGKRDSHVPLAPYDPYDPFHIKSIDHNKSYVGLLPPVPDEMLQQREALDSAIANGALRANIAILDIETDPRGGPKECQEDMQFAPADWRKP